MVRITYTVTYDVDGGSVPEPIQSPLSEGRSFVVAAYDGTKAGHTFAGWSEGDNVYEAGYEYTVGDSDVVLTAIWDINQYTIVFDANGATGDVPAEITEDYNSVVTLPDVGNLAKTGHTFGGWSLIADGTAIESPYTMTGNVTLYAVWNINKYTLSFNANGAEGKAPPSSDNDYNSVVTLPTAGSLHKTGHSFSGWSETAEGEAVTEPYTMPLGGKTLYAVWTVNQYTITFDTAGGSAVPAITQDYGTAITSPAAPTRTGYTFGGWSPALPATMPGANTTATAQWTINQYTISFSANGATGAVPAAITGDYDSTVPLPEAGSLAKAGYAFGGWSETADGTAVTLPYSMPLNGDTLYAIWNVEQYILVFDVNGATGVAPASITADYGSEVTLPDVGDMSKEGYIFGGWSNNPGGSTLLTPYKVNTDETLYAVWNIITYDELPDSEVISDIISQDDEPVLQVKGNAADQVLDNTIFQSIGDKPLTVDVVDDEGQVQYSWTFEGDYKSEAGTFKAGISEVTPEGDLSGAITSTGAENPLVLNFAASGELPINATVKYYVGDKYENGTKLTLFFYNETTKQLEEKAKDLVVTDGWVTLSLTHCSSYVLAEPAPASTPENSTMLYIGIGAAAAAILGAVAFFIIRRR